MRTSEKTDMIAAALSGVHKDLRNPRKDSKAVVKTKQGGQYSYEFLSLPALIDHAKKALDAHGVAVIQDVRGGVGFVEVSTVLMRLAGQYVEVGPVFLPASGDAQAYGSAITYGRRYALASALNLAADEDDDSVPPTGTIAGPPSPAPAPVRPSQVTAGADHSVVDTAAEGGSSIAYGEGATGDSPATSEQWDRLLAVAGGSEAKALTRLNKATHGNFGRTTKDRATQAQLAAAISGGEA